ncbi:MAG: helix-turn-helix transcriptional regulator [Gordonibacter sp.]|nr:helix-turn-helix transcriptional regulator [Gordonibacter sp.]
MIAKMRPVKMMRVREGMGITRAELSRRVGMQANMIAWIETGRFYPYPAQIEKIAKSLGVSSPQSLLEQIEEVPTDELAAV